MKKILLLLVFLSVGLSANAQPRHKTKNLIIVTLDGYRWKELFTGAEKALINNKKFTNNPKALKKKFWANSSQQRRKKLMPFFWNVIAKKGQIYGNRTLGNKVNVANPYWFSYPGYNEIFTGFPDKRINSNNYPANPNTNVLEFINKQPDFKRKVAAFASWDAFRRILNAKRSGFPVNDGYMNVKKNLNGKPLNEEQKALSFDQHNLPKIFGSERLDGTTYAIAKEFLKVNHPRVFYIGFGDTDDFAHQGHYGFYLRAAHYTDVMIKNLWDYLQSTPQYKNKTTLLITTDHGRGYGKEWTSHGSSIKHSNEIWFAVMGPDTPAAGEVKKQEQLYQKQFAQTMAHFLGRDFKADHPVGKRIKSVIKQ
jgi:hypothetical protein